MLIHDVFRKYQNQVTKTQLEVILSQYAQSITNPRKVPRNVQTPNLVNNRTQAQWSIFTKLVNVQRGRERRSQLLNDTYQHTKKIVFLQNQHHNFSDEVAEK
jgi:hypothetical protein